MVKNNNFNPRFIINFPTQKIITYFQMIGIGFTQFTFAAVAGNAGPGLLVDIFDSSFTVRQTSDLLHVWTCWKIDSHLLFRFSSSRTQNFQSEYVIRQQSDDGSPSFTVQMGTIGLSGRRHQPHSLSTTKVR